MFTRNPASERAKAVRHAPEVNREKPQAPKEEDRLVPKSYEAIRARVLQEMQEVKK